MLSGDIVLRIHQQRRCGLTQQAKVTLPDGRKAFVNQHALSRFFSRCLKQSERRGEPITLLREDIRDAERLRLSSKAFARQCRRHRRPAEYWLHPGGEVLSVVVRAGKSLLLVTVKPAFFWKKRREHRKKSFGRKR